MQVASHVILASMISAPRLRAKLRSRLHIDLPSLPQTEYSTHVDSEAVLENDVGALVLHVGERVGGG
jgi:hypothetical protein